MVDSLMCDVAGLVRFCGRMVGNWTVGMVLTKYSPFPETNSSHLKMDGWKTTFLLARSIFRGKLLVLGRVVWMIPETRSVTVVQTTIGENNFYARERNDLKF